ncbi:MAG: sulfocyanin-like copper-binding protein [Candidatus Lutacidiplasmatales archaeon]
MSVVIVVAVFSGLGAVRQVGARSTPSVTGATTIAVTAVSTGYAFTPNTFDQIATNSTITVTFTDASSVSHTFTIIGREGWVIPASITVTALNELAYGKTYPNLININVSSAGSAAPVTFTSPGPGWYEFICTQSGHFYSGMYGFVAFGMNLPSNLSVSSGGPTVGATVFIIIGSIVSLVVIALVLGFVVGRREGARHEMPPERLGYPEPPLSGAPLSPASTEDHRY